MPLDIVVGSSTLDPAPEVAVATRQTVAAVQRASVQEVLPPVYDGTVDLPTIREGDSGSYSFATDFSNATSFSDNGWPTGLSMNSAGLLLWDGTQTAGTTTGREVTATNSGGSASTGPFDLVIEQPLPSQTDVSLVCSDLISGPATGLGDGLGDGVIVTVWGFGLGSSQGGSGVGFRDSAGTFRPAAHVYYWKDADGQLPGGPANMFESHGMQEIAFSIPGASASGAGTLEVTVGGETATLPFTVRAGTIAHIADTGSDGSGSGTWASPWATIEYVFDDEQIAPGTIVYARDSLDGSLTSTGSAIQTSTGTTAPSATLAAQSAVIAYPNAQCTVSGRRGIWLTRISGVVCSKINTLTSSNADSTAPDGIGSDLGSGATFGIAVGKDFRVVGCRLEEQPGRKSSGSQGALVSNVSLTGTGPDNARVFCCEVVDYGANGSSQQHHTTYFAIRADDDPTLDAWEVGWLYLHGCRANLGVHNWDKDNTGQPENSAGNVNGTIAVHDCVIVDQGGAGLSTGTGPDWGCDFHYYNNVLINVGLAHDWDGVDTETVTGASPRGIAFVDGNLASGTTHYVENNLVIGWNGDRIVNRNEAAFWTEEDENVILRNNIFVDTQGDQFTAHSDGSTGISADTNVYYSIPGNGGAGIPGYESNAITTDPQVAINGVRVSVGNSALADAGVATTATILRDIYGAVRTGTIDIGPVEQ